MSPSKAWPRPGWLYTAQEGQAPGPECDHEILISVVKAKRKEQLLMLECTLLVQQSTLLNNSVLAAADALINWKGWVAQDVAEAVWSRRLGMEWKEDFFKRALKGDHYFLCHCYFFLGNHGAKCIFWATAVSPWVCICPELSCSDHNAAFEVLKAMKLKTPKSKDPPVPFRGR